MMELPVGPYVKDHGEPCSTNEALTVLPICLESAVLGLLAPYWAKFGWLVAAAGCLFEPPNHCHGPWCYGGHGPSFQDYSTRDETGPPSRVT